MFCHVFLFFKGKWPLLTTKIVPRKSQVSKSLALLLIASIDSGNDLFQEIVSRKQSSPDDETKTPKEGNLTRLNRKVNIVSSDDDENDASEKANTQRQHDVSEADAINL